MLVAIGASSGGLEAMIVLLQHLPADYHLPTVLVLHQRANRASGVPAMLSRYTHLLVQEPDDKQHIETGCLYVAPPNYHLLVESDRQFSLSVDAPVNYSRPSIDMLLESAAAACGKSLVACILSGANHDGAAGVVAVKNRGGRVYIQQPDDAAVAVMPRAAAASVQADGILSLPVLAQHLMMLQSAVLMA